MFLPSAYFTVLQGLPSAREWTPLAERVFGQVFRRNFRAPGAALLSLGPGVSSGELRAFQLALKEALGGLYHGRTGRDLVYLSLARFNQQVTTKFHLDGAPEEAYLLLGYEPSSVSSSLAIADYTRAAHDWGIDPKTLLSDFNPMFAGHERRLLPYVTRLEAFDPGAAQILLLNNSSLPYREDGGNVLGVMHQATVPNPRPDQPRVVNSIMLGVADDPSQQPVADAAQRWFLETDEVAGSYPT
jgi:hypothetical protein